MMHAYEVHAIFEEFAEERRMRLTLSRPMWTWWGDLMKEHTTLAGWLWTIAGFAVLGLIGAYAN